MLVVVKGASHQLAANVRTRVQVMRVLMVTVNPMMEKSMTVGFPRVGHVDTWLIDAVQRAVYQNHGVLMWPHWCNSANYQQTAETFGTVPLQNEALSVRWARFGGVGIQASRRVCYRGGRWRKRKLR